MTPDLLIACATSHEMAPFLKKYPAKTTSVTRTGLRLFFGHIHSKTYQLVLTGPGVFNTVHALTACLEQETPGLILQTGIAGAFLQSGLGIGDIAVAVQERYVHTGVTKGALEISPLPFDLIEGYPSTRQGVYPLDKKLTQACYDQICQTFQSQRIKISEGDFITVSAITASKDLADQIHQGFSPVMEAMEGAASAHVAQMYRIPFIEARAASNRVGERDKLKWDIKKAAEQIVKICTSVSCLD